MGGTRTRVIPTTVGVETERQKGAQSCAAPTHNSLLLKRDEKLKTDGSKNKYNDQRTF